MSVEVLNLSFSYAQTSVLKDISFTAQSGKFIGLLGSNGCGKSTLLKCILNLLSPSAGCVKILGKEVRSYGTKELAKTASFVPQKSALTMPLSVFELVLMGRYAHLKSSFSGYSQHDIAMVDEVLQTFGLTKFKERVANSLSGGEFARALLARAVVSEPKVLILDEPTSALDLSHAIDVLKLCARLTRELNLVTIAVLHDLNLASLICDEILMLKGGVIAYKGSASELYKPEILEEIYALKAEIIYKNDMPFVLPK